MQVNPLSSFWFQPEVEYLDHMINGERVKHQNRKVENI